MYEKKSQIKSLFSMLHDSICIHRHIVCLTVICLLRNVCLHTFADTYIVYCYILFIKDHEYFSKLSRTQHADGKYLFVKVLVVL